MAICVMAVVGAAPCQCFSPGENQTTSPGRISSTGPPHRCARPRPAVTTSVWPSGCVCQAVRAPGSKVTLAPATRAGSGAWNMGSMRTVPVKYSSGPLPEGCEPALLISISISSVRKQPLAGADTVRSALCGMRAPLQPEADRGGADHHQGADQEHRGQPGPSRDEPQRRIGEPE